MTSVVLICAVLSSLAGGVLLAYGMCVGMFRLFRIHSIQAAQQRAALAATKVAASERAIA